jgi:hypothetical protein
VRRHGLDSSGSEWTSMAGSYERGYELSGFIKGAKFLEKLRDY